MWIDFFVEILGCLIQAYSWLVLEALESKFLVIFFTQKC